MLDSLGLALTAFFGSAVVVAVAGIYLVRSGDEIAERRQLSRFWVGTTLLAFGTSLPELMTNISAARIDAPGLAIGNIFGANMADIFILGVLAGIYGAPRFFGQLSSEPRLLATLALLLVATALLFGAVSLPVTVGPFGLGAIVLAVIYLGGVWVLSKRRHAPDAADDGSAAPVEGGELRVWVIFGLSVAGILAAAPMLAWSGESIAEHTGLATGFVGVALLALVTTLPEAVTSVAALRRGSPEMVAGNLLGSCAFNVFVLFVADPFYSAGPILDTMQGEHIVSGLAALALIGFALSRMFLRREGGSQRLPLFALLIGGVYSAGLVLTFLQGV